MSINEVRDCDILKTWLLSDNLNFVKYFFKKRFKRKFVVGRHHRMIADKLNEVYEGKCTRLIINIAPRYSKTEMAVKNFIANGLAINPAARFIHLSYSDELALDNSSDIQDIMASPEYRALFDAKPDSKSTKKWYTKEGGGLYAVSTGGQVTGFGAGLVDEEEDAIRDAIDWIEPSIGDKTKFGGAIVIDDPIKPDDARSALIRNKVNNKFESTIRNRTNSRNTPIIIMMQRTDPEDLCGYLINLEPDKWEVLSIPCILEDEDGKMEALWPFKHTLEELLEMKETAPVVFETQYMQNPVPLEGLLLPKSSLKFDDLSALDDFGIVQYRFGIIDPADKGGDKYTMLICSAFELAGKIYVAILDVICNTRGILANSPSVIEKCDRYKVEHLYIESNGVGLAAIHDIKHSMGEEKRWKIRPFASSENKEVRILSHYEYVSERFIFSQNNNSSDYKTYMNDLTGYTIEGDNNHKKDAADVTTMAANVVKSKFKGR